jgi:hypothetical protein
MAKTILVATPPVDRSRRITWPRLSGLIPLALAAVVVDRRLAASLDEMSRRLARTGPHAGSPSVTPSMLSEILPLHFGFKKGNLLFTIVVNGECRGKGLIYKKKVF